MLTEAARRRLAGRRLEPCPPRGLYAVMPDDAPGWAYDVRSDRATIVDPQPHAALCVMTGPAMDIAHILEGSAVDLIYAFTYYRVAFTDLRYACFFTLFFESATEARARLDRVGWAGSQ